MPSRGPYTWVKPGTKYVEQELSVEEYRKLYEESEESPLHASAEGPEKIRIWDTLNGTQTKPLDIQWVHRHYLRKITVRCSACTYTSPYPDHVVSHVKDQTAAPAAHKQFEMLEREYLSVGVRPIRCSVCRNAFRHRGDAEMHGFDVQEQARAHNRAKAVVIRRFSLEPPAPSAVSVPAQVNGHHADGPEVNQVVKALRKTRRRGNRSRGRRRTSDQRDNSQ